MTDPLDETLKAFDQLAADTIELDEAYSNGTVADVIRAQAQRAREAIATARLRTAKVDRSEDGGETGERPAADASGESSSEAG